MVLGIVCLLVLEVVSVNGLIAPVDETDETLESLAKHFVNLEAVVQKQSAQIQNITKQLALLTKHTDTGISFSAFLKTTTTFSTKGRFTLKFDDVTNNIGGGYNQYSGVFRAPVSGMYMISLALESKTDFSADCFVVKQGKRMTELSLNMAYLEASDTSVFHVNAGDDISADCILYLGSAELIGGRLCSLTGYLLHAD